MGFGEDICPKTAFSHRRPCQSTQNCVISIYRWVLLTCCENLSDRCYTFQKHPRKIWTLCHGFSLLYLWSLKSTWRKCTFSPLFKVVLQLCRKSCCKVHFVELTDNKVHFLKVDKKSTFKKCSCGYKTCHYVSISLQMLQKSTRTTRPAALKENSIFTIKTLIITGTRTIITCCTNAYVILDWYCNNKFDKLNPQRIKHDVKYTKRKSYIIGNYMEIACCLNTGWRTCEHLNSLHDRRQASNNVIQ